MEDAELIEICTDFRAGILEQRNSDDMCAVVAWPLKGYLSAFCGIETECIETDLTDFSEWSGSANHIWLLMPDGRALDPTYDQFGGVPVYLGPPTKFHVKEGP